MVAVSATDKKFKEIKQLQEEAEKYGCVIEHYRRRVFMLHKGPRWTFLKHPLSRKPILRVRSVSVEHWKEAIKKGAEYLDSDSYRENI